MSSYLRDIQQELPYLSSRFRLSEAVGSQAVVDDISGIILPLVGAPVLGQPSLATADPLACARGGYAGALSGFQANVVAFPVSNGISVEGATARDPNGIAFSLFNAPGQIQVVINGQVVTSSLWLQNPVPNPSFEINATGWLNSGLGALNSGAATTRIISGSPPIGNAQGQVITTAASSSQGTGILVPGSFTAGQPYVISAYIRGNAGGELLQLGGADNVGGDAQGFNITATTGAVRYSFVYTPAVTHTSFYIYAATRASAAYTFFVDGVMVTPGASLGPYSDASTPATLSTGSVIAGPPQLVTATYDPVGMVHSVFVDGVQQATAVTAGAVATTITGNTQLLVATSSSTCAALGQDIAIYNGALPASRVLEHFQAFMQAWTDPGHVINTYPSIGVAQ